jgi:transcriptional regulator with PAS, ATPase and Fis domain
MPVLIDHFVVEFAREHDRAVRGISPEARAILLRYAWPGNVRELQHVIERAVLMASDGVLGDVSFSLGPTSVTPLAGDAPAADSDGAFAGLTLDEVEERLVRRALLKHGGNMQRTADELGLSRTALYRRLEKFGIRNDAE